MEITSRECKNYLIEGGDLIFIPLGSVERLGPHLPLGIKSYIVSAIAALMAEKNKGYCSPVIPYSTLCDTYAASGSVDVSPQMLYDFVYDVCKELVANGFRRIVFVSYFKELYYVVAEFFQNENIPIAWITPDSIPLLKAKDHSTRETSLALASLKLVGKQELLDRVLNQNQQLLGKYKAPMTEYEPLSSLRRIGRIGYKFDKDEFPVLPVEKIYIDEVIEGLNNWVDANEDTISALKDYAYYLSRGRYDRGLI